jgi:hypothetical protein
MKANYYEILQHAIEIGIEYGWNRAHKHTDEPIKEHLLSEIENGIWENIHNYFNFDHIDN